MRECTRKGLRLDLAQWQVSEPELPFGAEPEGSAAGCRRNSSWEESSTVEGWMSTQNISIRKSQLKEMQCHLDGWNASLVAV